jgi:osmotically-inducible protein OsmY
LKPTVSAAGVKDKIEDALKRASQIDATRISVEAAGNIVTLRGSVPSWRESREAECAAFSAPGVASVSNLLEIGY